MEFSSMFPRGLFAQANTNHQPIDVDENLLVQYRNLIVLENRARQTCWFATTPYRQSDLYRML
jgi:hypothetical protein